MKKLLDSGLTKEELIDAYRNVILSRQLDERIWILNRAGQVGFHISGNGQEVSQVAMVRAFDTSKDYFLPYYRDLGSSIAWGIKPEEVLMASFGKKEDPMSHGRQMPDHFGHKALRIVSHSSPVTTQFPLATGVAYAAHVKKEDYIVLTTTGDGSSNQGDFHESLNQASVMKLPVVFVIVNNGYAISTPVDEQYAAKKLSDRALGYGMPGMTLDGNDFTDTYLGFKKATDHARSGKGPILVEVMNLRLTAHSSDDDQNVYRTPEEIEQDKKNDPVPKMTQAMLDEGIMTQKEVDAMVEEVKLQINKATEIAENAEDNTEADLYTHVYAEAGGR